MTQAEIFDTFMYGIWNTNKPEDYNRFHNAVTVASTMGAKPTGPQINDQGTGDNGTEWLFPDGSTIHIITNDEGIGVRISTANGGNPMNEYLRHQTLSPRYNPNLPLWENVGQHIDGFDDEWIPPDVYVQPDPYELEDEAFA